MFLNNVKDHIDVRPLQLFGSRSFSLEIFLPVRKYGRFRALPYKMNEDFPFMIQSQGKNLKWL
jgi:hypothetical protein